MSRLRLFAVLAICFELIAGGILLILPVPATIADVGRFKLQLVVVTSMSLNYFATAAIFLYGIHHFKPVLRRAYLALAASVATSGILNLQYPLLLFAAAIPGPWVSYGGSLAILIPGVMLHYWAIRYFGSIVGVNSPFTSVPLLAMAVACLSAVTIAAPRIVAESAFIWFATHQLAAATCMVLNIFAGGIAYGVMHTIGPSYKKAFRWLVISTFFTAACLLNVIIAAYFGHDNAYTNLGFTAAPFILASIFYMAAGYNFCRVRFLGEQPQKTSQPGQGMLDAVLELAGLASNIRDVNYILDDLRLITARMKPDEPVSEADNRKLVEIYRKLEDYLVNHEPLRAFTRTELRSRLNAEAQQTLQRAGQ